MPGITYSANTITSPVWCADFLSRDHLVPGPIELDASGFSDNIVVAGTLVGRTFVERASGTGFGPAASGDDEVFILAFQADTDQDISATAVRPGTVIKENFLPDWTAISGSSPVLALLRATYVTQTGAA